MDLDYRNILKTHLMARRSRNPKYSQRAFARDLGLLPSRISEILNGRVGLSVQKAYGVLLGLGLGPEEGEIFLDLVRACHGRSKRERFQALRRLGMEPQKGPA